MVDSASLTVSVVLEVGELVAPLGNDAQRILQKGDDNQEASNRREVSAWYAQSVDGPLYCLWRAGSVAAGPQAACTSRGHSRLHRVGQRVQPVLNLACLLPDGVQGTRVVGGFGSPRAAEWALVAEVVARGASYLGHDWWRGGEGRVESVVEGEKASVTVRRGRGGWRGWELERSATWLFEEDTLSAAAAEAWCRLDVQRVQREGRKRRGRPIAGAQERGLGLAL